MATVPKGWLRLKALHGEDHWVTLRASSIGSYWYDSYDGGDGALHIENGRYVHDIDMELGEFIAALEAAEAENAPVPRGPGGLPLARAVTS